jgi:hypothetical protein
MDNITYCAALRPNDDLQSNKFENDKLGGKGSVISRTAGIVVQREGADGKMVNEGALVSTRQEGAAGVVLARRDPALNGDAQFDRVGVQPVVREATVLSGTEPIRDEGPAAPKNKKVRVDKKAAPATPPPQVAAPRPAIQETPKMTQPEKTKVRVRLSNEAMGRQTVSVREVSVSDTVVILAYDKDSDFVVEPPICGADSPITVNVGEKTYKCLNIGATADLADYFLVILIRMIEDTKGE